MAQQKREFFFESLDFASLHSLPILFVCENNEYSVYSHISKRQSKLRKIFKVAKSFGINSTKMNGNSVVNIYSKTQKIISNIRKNSRPFLIELDTFRQLEHCGPNHDDNLNYRTNKYLKFWNKKCPINLIEKKILKRKS